MNTYRADLHIHTVLSPCGDLEMSPVNILDAAKKQNIQIIGICDHNTTLQCEVIQKIAGKYDIMVLPGAEVTSREEVHCLSFFPDTDSLNNFQQYLELHIPHIPNDIDKFGYQLVVDEKENICLNYPWLLISGIDQTVDQISRKVHSLGGIFIPAHIDRPKYSLISQLGFIPPDIEADAFEISRHTTTEAMVHLAPWLKNKTFIRSSDAHYLQDIGRNFSQFHMYERSFIEIKKALNNEDGRKVTL
ncbi:MAG: PHP domain-containing protein [Bacteroidales bacterium]|nr:PHP domain-containing protein [Bacteroidales bacterium]